MHDLVTCGNSFHAILMCLLSLCGLQQCVIGVYADLLLPKQA